MNFNKIKFHNYYLYSNYKHFSKLNLVISTILIYYHPYQKYSKTSMLYMLFFLIILICSNSSLLHFFVFNSFTYHNQSNIWISTNMKIKYKNKIYKKKVIVAEPTNDCLSIFIFENFHCHTEHRIFFYRCSKVIITT